MSNKVKRTKRFKRKKKRCTMKNRKYFRGGELVTDELRRKKIAQYEKDWRNYMTGNDEGNIYDKLIKIAKKKYSIDRQMAQYEENLLQRYLERGEASDMFNEYYHNKVIEAREIADREEMAFNNTSNMI